MFSDAHLHFIPEEIAKNTSFFKGPWCNKEKIFEYLDKNNIGYAFLVYPYTDAYLKLKGGVKEEVEVYNNKICEVFHKEERVIKSAILDLTDIHQGISSLGELYKRGFRGISLPSSFRGKFFIEELFPLFEEIEKFNLPIFIHPQIFNPIGFERVKDPLLMPVLEYSFDVSMCMGLIMVNEVLKKFKINFIFSSLGGVISFLKERFDRVYAMLRKREMVKDLGGFPSSLLKNFYVETAGCNLSQIKMAISLFGEDKVLWGSDYPANQNIERDLESLKELGTLKNKLTRENFLKLFNL